MAGEEWRGASALPSVCRYGPRPGLRMRRALARRRGADAGRADVDAGAVWARVARRRCRACGGVIARPRGGDEGRLRGVHATALCGAGRQAGGGERSAGRRRGGRRAHRRRSRHAPDARRRRRPRRRRRRLARRGRGRGGGRRRRRDGGAQSGGRCEQKRGEEGLRRAPALFGSHPLPPRATPALCACCSPRCPARRRQSTDAGARQRQRRQFRREVGSAFWAVVVIWGVHLCDWRRVLGVSGSGHATEQRGGCAVSAPRRAAAPPHARPPPPTPPARGRGRVFPPASARARSRPARAARICSASPPRYVLPRRLPAGRSPPVVVRHRALVRRVPGGQIVARRRAGAPRAAAARARGGLWVSEGERERDRDRVAGGGRAPTPARTPTPPPPSSL